MPHDLQRLRHVPLEGMTNLRNLGGYHTVDGTKITKWGVLYRGDHPSKVPANIAQQILVEQLRIRHTVDLRDATETAKTCYDFPHICRCSVPIDMSRMDALLPSGANVNDGTVALRLMQDYYRHLVRAEGPAIGEAIKTIVSTHPTPDNATLVHCTGGKDRTGWTMYVLLTLLDIAEAEKRADYELTNRCFVIPPEAYAYEGAAELSKESFEAFWRVSPTYLEAAIDEVNKLGGVTAYATSHMGLTDADIQQLRDTMLE